MYSAKYINFLRILFFLRVYNFLLRKIISSKYNIFTHNICLCLYFYSYDLVAIVSSCLSLAYSTRFDYRCIGDLANEIFKLARHRHVHCAWLGSFLHVRVLEFILDCTAGTSRQLQQCTTHTAQHTHHS
jgi:hypothetical protein